MGPAADRAVRRDRDGRRRWARAAALAAFAAALGATGADRASFASPSDPENLSHHALSHDGRMMVDGTKLAFYDSEFEYDVDVDDDFLVIIFPGGIYVDGGIEVEVDDPEDVWSSLSVEGPDRYALRRDGRLKRNDEKLHHLPWIEGTAWLDLAVAGGHTFAIRSDGALAVDDDFVATFPRLGFVFRRVLHDGDHVWSLRDDGTVFRDSETDPSFEFRAGDGPWGGADGDTIPATWIALARDPLGPWLYALRADGHVVRGAVDGTGGSPSPGESVAVLPFDVLTEPLAAQVYTDLEFTADGRWLALAGDGRVYGAGSPLVPVADLPGRVSVKGEYYADLATYADRWFCLRADGNVYADGDATEVFALAGDGYGSLAISDDPPALGPDQTKAPKVTSVLTKTVVGSPLRIPVVIADQDTPLADLVVTPVDPLPPGATWDAAGRALVWDSPGPSGEHLFKFDVADDTHVTRGKYTLKLRNPDADLDANQPPMIPKFDAAVAVVGTPWTAAIVVDDKDGDALTVTVDPAKYPFTAGAAFDPVTRVFSWTPAFEDEGTLQAKFTVTDGRKTEKLILELKVKVCLGF